MLELNRPLVVFDLETTGLSVANDRIVEISFLKIESPSLVQKKWTERINPCRPISAEAYAVHGITDDEVKDKPTFKEMSASFHQFLQGCDLAGFNCLRFDVPMLAEEFIRSGICYPVRDTKIIDVASIFKQYERRTLEAALKFYCNKDLDQAHSADADTVATYEVLLAQLQRYPDISKRVDELDDLSCYGTKTVDWAGKIVRDQDGDFCYNFSNKKGTKIKDHPGLAEWMLNHDFTLDTKYKVGRILQHLKVKV